MKSISVQQTAQRSPWGARCGRSRTSASASTPHRASAAEKTFGRAAGTSEVIFAPSIAMDLIIAARTEPIKKSAHAP